jgi:ubiquinone/menaquinone biosynthesis C-methylase UbiE
MIRRVIEIVKMIREFGLKKTLEVKKSSDLAKSFLQGFVASHVIFTLFNVGFFDECKKKNVNIKLFCKKNGLDERILCSLCDYLYSLKILKRKGHIYSLDSKGRMIADMSRGFFDVWYAYHPVLYNLESIVKRKKLYGRDVVRREEYVAKGSGEIGRLLVFPLVAKIIQRYRFQKVLDLGCGNAEFLISLCKSNPNLLGYGIDISREVVVCAKSRIKKENLNSRIKIYKGDVFEIDKIANKLDIDVLTSFFMLHEFLFKGKKKIIKFFEKCKKFKGKYLIVCEYSKRPDQELRKKPTLNIEYQMIHTSTSQGLISREEWKKLFEEVGFTIVEEKYFDSCKLCVFLIRI